MCLPRLSHPAADNFVFSRSSNWAVFGVNKDSSKFLWKKNKFTIPHTPKNHFFPLFFKLRNRNLPHAHDFSLRVPSVFALGYHKVVYQIWTRFDKIKIPHTIFEWMKPTFLYPPSW